MNAKCLNFIGQKSNEAFKWAKEIMPRFFDISPAVEFPKLIQLLSTSNKLAPTLKVEKDSAEWQEVDQLLKKSIGNARILAIDMNMNMNQWKLFSVERKRLADKAGKAPQEKLLWHGTRNTPSQVIINSDEGLNINYAGDGMWGKGMYFAVNASYSHKYKSTSADGKNQFFLAHVLLGESVKLESDGSLKEPPMKADGLSRYDSVQGHTNGSDVFMVYASRKALAKYLVTYELY